MTLRGRLSTAFGFGYLGSVALVVGTLVALGCVLERLGLASGRYDAAVVAATTGLLRPIDLVPVGSTTAPAAESVAPADEPV